MASILGLFDTAESAADATVKLDAAGFTNDEWEVLTDTPYPEGAFGEKDPKHTLFRYPFVGALLGFFSGLLITLGTQVSFPLVTGGKPIASFPPMIIIMYEGTMLGALIFTTIGIIIESRLPRLTGPGLYDTRITEGHIALVLDAPAERISAAEGVFREAGAVDIKQE